MNIRIIALAAAAMTAVISGGILNASSHKDTHEQNASKWADSHFRRGVVPPFSFSYNGTSSETFLKKWKYARTKGEGNSFKVEYASPDGLTAWCDVTVYDDFNAVEWTLHFRNAGNSRSGQISKVRSLNVALPSKTSGTFVLNHIKGSNAAVDDFAPYYDRLSDRVLNLHPDQGRSSCTNMPYFNLIWPSGTEGVVISVGWTGSWTADFSASSKLAEVEAGLMTFDSYLEPGEEFRAPMSSLMFWKGSDSMEGEETLSEDGIFMNMCGNNKFRRFMLAHHSRKINGRTAEYPLCGGFNYGDPEPLNEYTGMTADYAKFVIDRYAEFDIFPDAFWLDAGWYKNAADWKSSLTWANTVGSWTEDTRRFPNTLKEISDHAHAKAEEIGKPEMGKLMVWFEPERVYKGSDIFNEHHDWLLFGGNKIEGVLNLGNREACGWLSRYIGDFLESRGIDIYRQDFNIYPDVIWAANDKEGRKGMTEVLYIEGLYRYLDYLLNRFPNMLIDNCASGGRRLDIEMAKRGAPLWRTDYSYGEVNGYQNQTYGLEFFLPQSGTANYQEDKYSSRSCFCSSMVMHFKLTDKNSSFFRMKDVYDEYAEVRPYYLEDYYPLAGTSEIASLDRWIAYELFRPSDGTGYIFAFRRPESNKDEYVVKLKGLDAARKYSLLNKDTGEKASYSGKSLMHGLTLRIEEPRSSLLLKILPEW